MLLPQECGRSGNGSRCSHYRSGQNFTVLFACIRHYFPRQGGNLNCAGRTSRDSHPSEDLSKLRTGVSLWADGIMAGTACQSCLGLSGYRSAPYLAVL